MTTIISSPKSETILTKILAHPETRACTGKLAKTANSFILDLPDAWVLTVKEELAKFGYSLPPAFKEGGVGANVLISKVPSLHARKKSLVDPELKDGMEVEFQVVKVGKSLVRKKGLTGERVEEVYKVCHEQFKNIHSYCLYQIWVKSSGLEKITKKIAGYSQVPSGGFHIMLGVKKV